MSGKDSSSHRWLSEGAETLAREVSAPSGEALHCDVLIVGSGYGGSVAAARLAGATRPDGRRAEVFVLERGQEYLPGAFPATFAELPGHVRFSQQDGKPARGRPEGLFDVRIGRDVNVVLGNGLGGGSLINAAVMERATADAFDVERADGDGLLRRRAWPADIDLRALQPWYGRAEAALEPRPIPRSVAKLDALFDAADAMGAREKARAKVAIAFAEGQTPAGVVMKACVNCGDCVSGCNHQAKQSLDVNYLALAQAGGARLFCGATAHRVRQAQQGFEVEFYLTDPGKARSDRARPYCIRAQRVILAAGTLGSTEILQRSARHGLPVASTALGANFSGNGDMIAVAYRQIDRAPCCGREGDAPAAREVGPTITGLVRHRAKELARPLVFEEFAIPAPLRRVFGELVAATDALHGLARIDCSRHAADERVDDPLAVSDDALDHTLVYGMMGDDGAGGRIELVEPQDPEAQSTSALTDARVRIAWPDAARPALFEAQLNALRHAHERAGGRGGRVLPNPLWRPLPRFEAVDAFNIDGPITSVHPLGGCPMADDPLHGVVDSHGRVHAGTGGLLRGLAVLDGSIVPAALGINPSLTIAALAERAIPELARDWQLRLRSHDESRQRQERPIRRDTSRPKAPEPTTLRLRERLSGRLRIDGEPFDAAAQVTFAPAGALALRKLPWVVPQPEVVLTLRDASRRVTTIACHGSASILVREPSSVLRRVSRSAWRAWRRIRQSAIGPGARFSVAGLLELIALCSHLGQVRLIRYDWIIDSVDGGSAKLNPGERLRLIKRIAFTTAGNPWRQLCEGQLVRVGAEASPLGRLELDLSYFVEQLAPLLQIESQQDQPNAIGDLVALGAWVLRVLLRVHPLAFLPPTDRSAALDTRLPGPLSGVTPEIIEFEPLTTITQEGQAVPVPKARLSRYARQQAATPQQRPVLLIHGYGAGGSTFAHPSIGVNLVQALLRSGREVWVLDLRNSIGLEQRHYWPLDEIAQQDVPRAIGKVLEHGAGSGDGKLDVVAHCIGAAMFSVAVLKSSVLHASIGSVVLSQVGPLLRMSPFNRFRGFVASYLQQFIGTEVFDVKSDASPANKTLLIDALLASYPYPDDDREAERLKIVPGFAAVRHRADAIFGQLLQLDNVGDETLRSLDAIFGWVMVKGLAQTIHYAREQLLTDASGLNRVVSHELLAERFDFPLLLLHGRNNKLFDWRGSYDTLRRLSEVFEGVGLAEEPPTRDVIDAGTSRRLRLLDGYGHQDTLIGQNAHRDVFPHIVGFLDEFARHQPLDRARGRKPVVVDLPWLGPMLGRVVHEADSGQLVCRIGLRPPPARARVAAVVYLPALRIDGGANWFFCRSGAVIAPTCIDRLRDTALEVRLRSARVPEFDGFAVVIVDCDAASAIAASSGSRPNGLFAAPDRAPSDEILDAVEARLGAPGVETDPAVVQLDAGWVAAACEQPPQPSLCFALASCQFPPGLVDRRPAQRSFERLALRLREARADDRPQLLILSGDQVYVDAAAGLFDPAGATDIDRVYPLSLTLPALRRVFKALPTLPLLGNQEVENDWEPRAGEPAASVYAVQAYRRFQHSLVDAKRDPPFDYTAAPAGFPFFMLDVRSTRERRALRPTADAVLLDEASIHEQPDLLDLCNWLEQQPHDVPKFVVTSVPVFPLPRAALCPRSAAERLALDDWSGFPRSQFALLDCIRSRRIRNVVLLSGDRHMSSVSSLWIDDDDGDAPHGPHGPPIEVVSIVSSGLYAPWPFANSRPDDFVLDGRIELSSRGGARLDGTLETCATGTQGGYASIRVERDTSGGGGGGGAWTIDVQLDLADGIRHCRRTLGGGRRPAWKTGALPTA